MAAITLTEVAIIEDVVFDNMTSRISSNTMVLDWADATELDMAGESARLAPSESFQAMKEAVPYCSGPPTCEEPRECTASLAVAEPSDCSEQTTEPVSWDIVEPKVDAALTVSPEPVSAADNTESAPMLPGLRLQGSRAAPQVEAVSQPESSASTFEAEQSFSLIEELRGRPQTKHLFQSVDGGAEAYMGRGTRHQRIATPLEDILGPGCVHDKGQTCPVHYKHGSAKAWLQSQGDALRKVLQDEFRRHDRERAGHERQYKFLCGRDGEAKAQAKIDYHKNMVRTLGPLFRSVQKNRLRLAFEDEDAWLDD
ncbi:hypothetical protein DOTSEDRAFT_23217 [Dothistroma septosporum NZE10]|uniref:Uncharacterized protein n=1 Tax=Dothistroma septosporum (strain NZE10 / CBS 128990) TaxID=675120 RepID=N1PS13_DOTSN|nr:hypothetical protein DOTSEDRAFT_23217 [Dothistroma septosporum NZE10]